MNESADKEWRKQNLMEEFPNSTLCLLAVGGGGLVEHDTYNMRKDKYARTYVLYLDFGMCVLHNNSPFFLIVDIRNT